MSRHAPRFSIDAESDFVAHADARYLKINQAVFFPLGVNPEEKGAFGEDNPIIGIHLAAVRNPQPNDFELTRTPRREWRSSAFYSGLTVSVLKGTSALIRDDVIAGTDWETGEKFELVLFKLARERLLIWLDAIQSQSQLGDVALPVTRDQVFAVFRHAAAKMWSNASFVLPHVVLAQGQPSDVRPGSTAYANLAWTGRNPTAIGNSILRRAELYALRVADRLLEQDAETIRKVMTHEAGHLGYPKHDRNFRDLVRQHDGAVSEEALEGRGIEVERKEGARYQVIRRFTDEREAERWAKEEMKRVPGRYRLSLGGLSSFAVRRLSLMQRCLK